MDTGAEINIIPTYVAVELSTVIVECPMEFRLSTTTKASARFNGIIELDVDIGFRVGA